VSRHTVPTVVYGPPPRVTQAMLRQMIAEMRSDPYVPPRQPATPPRQTPTPPNQPPVPPPYPTFIRPVRIARPYTEQELIEALGSLRAPNE
jgi:hypothetical protein